MVRETTAFQEYFDGIRSSWGIITKMGFESGWHSCIICTPTVTSSVNTINVAFNESLLPPTTSDLKIEKHILSCFALSECYVRMLRPTPHGPKQAEGLNALYFGSLGGPLVAVVSSLDGVAWTWQGLYEWPRKVKLPQFQGEVMRII
jgi:hypothetical protein